MRGGADLDAGTLRRALVLVATLACVALPLRAHAQTIRGRAVDSTTQAPLPGVVILLLGDGDAVKARGLTNEEGAFLLVAPGAGEYRLRAMRIGFRPVTLPTERLSESDNLVKRLALLLIPARLDTVRVTGRNQCRSTSEQTLEVGALWEQARTALLATQMTISDRPLGGTAIVYDRALAPGNNRVTRHSARVVRGMTQRLWGSPTAEVLRRDGYVMMAEGTFLFHAPDLDVLLSPEFGEDHCFRIAQTSDTSRVGIAFEPNRNRRRIPEIEGTLWLERSTSRLKEIGFTYTNVPLPDMAGKAGGRMEFVPLANEAWAISRWDIRMPLVVQRNTQGMGGVNRILAGMNYITEVQEIRVHGGELALVTQGEDTLWTRKPIAIEGMVLDSASGAPVVGAHVRVAGTGVEASTEPGGWFTLADMLPGAYELRVSTPSLDTLGATHRVEVNVTSDSGQIVVRVPSRASVIQALCPQGVGAQDGMLVGFVRLDTGRMADVSVRAEWYTQTVRSTGDVDRLKQATSVRTNASGMYRICGVPQQTDLTLVAEAGDTAAATATLKLPADKRVGETDLSLVVRVVAVAAVSDTTPEITRRYARLIRGVVRDTSGAFIDHARITVTQSVATVSDQEGDFVLPYGSRGGFILDVRRIGYEPQRIEIPPGGDTLITVRLTTLARSLAAVRVEARSISNSLLKRGFYTRQSDSEKGIARGTFFTAEDIERRNPTKIEYMLGDQPGLRVMSNGNAVALVGTMREMVADANGNLSMVPCNPTIYLDGMRLNTMDGTSTERNISNLVDARSISGMEVYARGVNAPPQYPSLNAGCAVIIIWTKM